MPAHAATAGRPTRTADLMHWAIAVLIIATAIGGTLWIDRNAPLMVDETAAEASAAANP